MTACDGPVSGEGCLLPTRRPDPRPCRDSWGAPCPGHKGAPLHRGWDQGKQGGGRPGRRERTTPSGPPSERRNLGSAGQGLKAAVWGPRVPPSLHREGQGPGVSDGYHTSSHKTFLDLLHSAARAPKPGCNGNDFLSPLHTPGRVLGQTPPQTGALHEVRHPPDGQRPAAPSPPEPRSCCRPGRPGQGSRSSGHRARV